VRARGAVFSLLGFSLGVDGVSSFILSDKYIGDYVRAGIQVVSSLCLAGFGFIFLTEPQKEIQDYKQFRRDALQFIRNYMSAIVQQSSANDLQENS